VVPGRDRYIRRAPLQPEQDSAVRIHILQLHPRNSRSPIRPRFINLRANEKHVEVGQSLNSGAAGEPEQERWFHPPPRASPKLSWRQDRGMIVTRSRYPRCERRRAIMCRNSGENVYSIHPERVRRGACIPDLRPTSPFQKKEKKRKREIPEREKIQTLTFTSTLPVVRSVTNKHKSAYQISYTRDPK